MKYAWILAIALWASPAGADETSQHFYGFDADRGSLCHFYDVKLEEKGGGEAELTFALDTGAVLKNSEANYVADEESLRYTLKGRFEEKNGELLFVANYPGKPFSYDYHVALDPESKEIRRFESFSSYRALLEKLNVREMNCRDVVGVQKFHASYLSRTKALEAMFPKAKDFPNCLSAAKYALSMKHKEYENAMGLGLAAIGLGLAFPPSASYAIPFGMLLIGANEAGGHLSGDFKMLDKSREMAQLLYQAYLYEKSEHARFNFPLLSKMAHELGVSERAVVDALKKAPKELCFAENPEGGDPLYEPKDFSEIRQVLSARVPGAKQLDVVKESSESQPAH